MQIRTRSFPANVLIGILFFMTLRAAAIQFEHIAGAKDKNFARIEAFTRDAAAQRVELIAFPECCITGYWFIRNLTRQQIQDLA